MFFRIFFFNIRYIIVQGWLCFLCGACIVEEKKPADSAVPVVLDIDGDGFTLAEGDCDDENPGVNPMGLDEDIDGIDQNCDGIDGPDVDGDGWVDVAAGGSDCDDLDPESTTTESDPDCDGYESWADCDDEDPLSTHILEDADCNGFVDWPCFSLSSVLTN